jgi:hypothetical protein
VVDGLAKQYEGKVEFRRYNVEADIPGSSSRTTWAYSTYDVRGGELGRHHQAGRWRPDEEQLQGMPTPSVSAGLSLAHLEVNRAASAESARRLSARPLRGDSAGRTQSEQGAEAKEPANSIEYTTGMAEDLRVAHAICGNTTLFIGSRRDPSGGEETLNAEVTGERA